jgi:hypothetical protein
MTLRVNDALARQMLGRRAGLRRSKACTSIFAFAAAICAAASGWESAVVVKAILARRK